MNKFLLLALFLTLIFPIRNGFPAFTTTQHEGVILRPEPASLNLTLNQQGAATIVVENVNNLYGLEFHLAYDPGLVQVVDADASLAGTQIAPSDRWQNGFVALNQADNRRGRVDFAATLLSPAPALEGEQPVAVITFVARQAGQDSLRLESAILSTADAEVIPCTTSLGWINVTSSSLQAAPQQAVIPDEASPEAATTGQVMLAALAVIVFLIAGALFIHTWLGKKPK